MKTSITILLICSFLICQAQDKNKDTLKTYLSIAIPQRSGIASADFKYYRIKNDSLFVYYQPALALGTTLNYELLETYAITKKELNELDSLLSQTSFFGDHILYNSIMGWPRFSIYAKYKGKKFDGFIANCYREHIFAFIDWLNKVYPKGGVIEYDKIELINREKN